jgi:hypothetical protein
MINTKEKERRLGVIREGTKKKAKVYRTSTRIWNSKKKSSKKCKTC